MGAKRLCHPHPSAAVEKNLKSKIKSRDFFGAAGHGGWVSRRTFSCARLNRFWTCLAKSPAPPLLPSAMAAARFLLAAARCGLMFCYGGSSRRSSCRHPPSTRAPSARVTPLRKGSAVYPETWVGQRGDGETCGCLLVLPRDSGLGFKFGFWCNFGCWYFILRPGGVGAQLALRDADVGRGGNSHRNRHLSLQRRSVLEEK